MDKQVTSCSGSYCKRASFVLLAFLPILFALTSRAQPKPLKDIKANMHNKYDSLKLGYGANKHMPAVFEKQIIYALSYFPTLKRTRIRFKLNATGIIATRPAWGSIFKKSGRRTYIVTINDSKESKWSRFLFMHADVNGQVGILGHELTHILNFERKNTWGLLGIGLGHVSKAYMDRFENKTDSLCIELGFGHQLISWNIFLRKAFGMDDPENAADPFLADATRERYMSPASIRRVMKKSALYQNNHP